MRARIVRGAAQVGGSCVEVESSGDRLVIDVGLPLDAGPRPDVGLLPSVAGLVSGPDAPLGVVVSHGHLDHFGLVGLVRRDVPVFMGAVAHRVLTEAAFFSSAGVSWPLAGELRDRVSFEVGPFTITPYLVDHSAVDAYAILVEANGRRLLYSGDLRAHGRAGAWQRFLEHPPTQIDALLLEGTHVGRGEEPDAGVRDEEWVQEELMRVASHTRGLVAVVLSAQNLDRLAAIYAAARGSGRTLVVDLYSQTLARVAADDGLPQVGDLSSRVFVPHRQRLTVARSREFDRVAGVSATRIFPEEIAARSGELMVALQGSSLRELVEVGCLDGGRVAWSLWAGYLDRTPAITTLLRDYGVPLSVVHASGHARIVDLQRFATTVAPGRVIPIHTNAPQRYLELFPNVCVEPDGKWWDV